MKIEYAIWQSVMGEITGSRAAWVKNRMARWKPSRPAEAAENFARIYLPRVKGSHATFTYEVRGFLSARLHDPALLKPARFAARSSVRPSVIAERLHHILGRVFTVVEQHPIFNRQILWWTSVDYSSTSFNT
jgi:hypothetical protein